MTSSTSSHYSSESQTTEIYEISSISRRLLKYSIVAQALLTAVVTGCGIYMLTQCPYTNFAGVTTMIGLTVFLLQITTGYCAYSKYRGYTLVIGVLGLVGTMLLCANEVGSWICSQEETHYLSGFCISFRKNADPCRWVKKTTLKPSTTTDSITGITVDDDYDDDLVLGRKYAWVRITILVFSHLSLSFNIITLLVLGVSIKIGRPVYLNRKRHKRSIVVGQRKNVLLADANKRRNLNLTKPNDNELKYYDQVIKESLRAQKEAAVVYAQEELAM